MKAQPYINFEGHAEEALNFYKKAIGAEIGMVMRCGEAPEGPTPRPELKDKILHSEFRVGSTVLFASDGYNSNNAKFEGISIALEVANEAEADRAFTALADGGAVTMPLTKTFFAKSFGMLKDKFGVTWMINCPAM